MVATILRDVVATLTSYGPDDGVPGTGVGSAVTVCLDKISISETRDLFDASCEQDAFSYMRSRKNSWEIKVDTKLEQGLAFWESLHGNNSVMLQFVMVAGGTTVTGAGIVAGLEVEIGNPSTLSITIQSAGSGLAFS